MKVAVLGATGMLGSMLVKYLSQHFEVVATVRDSDYKPTENVTVKQIDVNHLGINEINLTEALNGCQWVINAIGAIPQRVSRRADFVAINSLFPIKLYQVLNIGCQVIQIATDCVFQGVAGDYTEKDNAHPVDIYGESKLIGEVEADNMHHIRCSIIGPERHGQSLMGWLLSQPKGASVSGYTNHYWNGVTTLHFAKVCRGIIENKIQMPYMQHLVPADIISKYSLLLMLAKEFDRTDITIDAVKTVDGVNRSLATTNKGLNNSLWDMAGYTYPPTIKKMVKELAEYELAKDAPKHPKVGLVD